MSTCLKDIMWCIRTVVLTQNSSLDHSSTSSLSWLGCSTVGHWGCKALCLLLALTSASSLQLTLYSVGYVQQRLLLSRDTTRCSSPGLSRDMRSLQATEIRKGASISVEEIRTSEKEFPFGARKPIFLGVHRFRFLSRAFWKTVTFVFIYFFLMLSFLFIFSPYLF